MENLQFLGVAAVMLAVAGGMAFYEWTRIKAGKPILKGHQAVALYWVAYLTLFVLGVTTALAAIIR
jgi:divalent metal cation (Fe/Co/Zn/Cd) transporter